MRRSPLWIFLALLALPLCASAQWLNQRDPSVPRTRDGKPNLTAPAPHRGGKPDLSGLWEAESSPRKDVEKLLLPGGENGLGEDVPSKYFLNFFSDFPFLQEPFQPAAGALYHQGLRSGRKPRTLCPPPSITVYDLNPAPFKIVQIPGLTMMLYEGNDIFYRQIFTDGRKLPADPQPSWLGYSVGKWEGDSFVIDTIGLNDKNVLDAMGHSYSESMRLTERFRRRDFGHMDLQITVDDSKTYTKPVTVKVGLRLVPDSDLIESFCTEGETDLAHLPGK
jgi:hypothetical protein